METLGSMFIQTYKSEYDCMPSISELEVLVFSFPFWPKGPNTMGYYKVLLCFTFLSDYIYALIDLSILRVFFSLQSKKKKIMAFSLSNKYRGLLTTLYISGS